MRKLIVLCASALVLALGAAQASATLYDGSPCNLSPQDVTQAYAVPAATDARPLPLGSTRGAADCFSEQDQSPTLIEPAPNNAAALLEARLPPPLQRGVANGR